MFPLYDSEKFKEWILAQPGMEIVDNMHTAQWLTIDGILYGNTQANVPHEIQAQVVDYLQQWPAYQALTVTATNFWSIVHEGTGLVRVVPDTEIVRTMIGQNLSAKQTAIITNADFELEPYTKNRKYFTYNL